MAEYWLSPFFGSSLFQGQEQWSDSPYINHFLQPDSIIPDFSNPQSWNRYSYVTNRPIVLADPTGHKGCTMTSASECDDTEEEVMKMLERGKGYEKVIERLMRSKRTNYRTAAISLAIDVFGIQIPDATGSDYDLDISYDHTLTDANGQTDPEDARILIRIGPSAFEFSAARFAATLAHEFCHANQVLGASCYTSPKMLHTVGYRDYGLGPSEGWAMNEVEAWDFAITKANRYGATRDEISDMWESRNIYYDSLIPENQMRATRHYYIVEPGTAIYP